MLQCCPYVCEMVRNTLENLNSLASIVVDKFQLSATFLLDLHFYLYYVFSSHKEAINALSWIYVRPLKNRSCVIMLVCNDSLTSACDPTWLLG